MLRGLANWWDSVELWVTQLAFPWQVLLAGIVLLPLCAGVAVLADRVADVLDGLVGERVGVLVDAWAGRRAPLTDEPTERPDA